MRLSLGGVVHEFLRLEIAEDRQHRRVREVRGQLVAHFRDRSRSEIPQHTHHVELAIAQDEIVHGILVY